MLRVREDGTVELHRCVRCGHRKNIDPDQVCRGCLDEYFKLGTKEW